MNLKKLFEKLETKWKKFINFRGLFQSYEKIKNWKINIYWGKKCLIKFKKKRKIRGKEEKRLGDKL